LIESVVNKEEERVGRTRVLIQ